MADTGYVTQSIVEVLVTDNPSVKGRVTQSVIEVITLFQVQGAIALNGSATQAAIEGDYIAHDTFDEAAQIPLSSHLSNSGDSWGASSGNMDLVVTTSGYVTWQ